jgi:carboxymethylenebutenolidase
MTGKSKSFGEVFDAHTAAKFQTPDTLVSRTVGKSQLVDELILSSTHDCEMPAILPGIKPTGRKVAVPTVVSVGFDQDSQITHEHIYWDQATMLVQLGLLDKAALPVTGAEQAARLLDPKLPSNTLIAK